jgi:protocatechuate 3,4-dioxygenase beta subunit
LRILRLAPVLLFCSLISVALAQQTNDPGEPGVVTGQIIDSAGESVAGAKVCVRERHMPQTGAVRFVITDQKGQFRIQGLRPGDYDVYAVPGHSASMLSHWTQRVHLPKGKPFGKVTIQIGSSANREG